MSITFPHDLSNVQAFARYPNRVHHSRPELTSRAVFVVFALQYGVVDDLIDS